MLNFFQLGGQGLGFMCHILGIFEVGLLCAEQRFAFICTLVCAELLYEVEHMQAQELENLTLSICKRKS